MKIIIIWIKSDKYNKNYKDKVLRVFKDEHTFKCMNQVKFMVKISYRLVNEGKNEFLSSFPHSFIFSVIWEGNHFRDEVSKLECLYTNTFQVAGR